VATLTWTSIAAGTLCGLQITRDGATITGWLNGTTKTGSIGAATSLSNGLYTAGADNSGSYFDGRIDYLRAWRSVRTSRKDIFYRLLNPRSKDVLFNYVFSQGEADDVLDYGVLGAHATVAGSPAWDGAPLAINPAPIQALSYNVRKDGTREVVAVAYGRVHTATVA